MKVARQARNVALGGVVIQAVLAATAVGIRLGTHSQAAWSCLWLVTAGAAVWLMLALVFYCRQLQRQEDAELEELAAGAGRQTGAIFDRQRDLSLRPAAARVRFVERWVAWGFTLLLAFFHVGTGLLAFRAAAEAALVLVNHGQGLLFGVVAAFVGFLFSRYATGMSGRAEWQPLRSGASAMLLATLALAGVLASLVAGWWGYPRLDRLVAFLLPAAQIVLAAELALSLVLDLYRPRLPGQPHRFSFDSRLCGLLAEPGKVGHSIAEALNYQFGFEVSRTWFYRLLSKALLPLIAFAAVVLVAMTSIVVVYQGQQCVVLHWGRRDAGRVLGPGLHLKWPWPVDTARHFETSRIHQLLLGVGQKREPVIVNGRELMLWSARHGAYEEQDFLLAVPAESAAGPAPAGARATGPGAAQAASGPASQSDSPKQPAQKPPPVRIIKLVASVQYQIQDVFKFAYRFVDAENLLHGAAQREMVRYCASATLDSPVAQGGPDRPEAIMTFGWGRSAESLGKRIQDAVGPGGLDLGVRIVAVKLLAVHPPAEAAGAFQAVLEAERRQDQLRYQAEAEANRTLARVAGDPATALELALAIRRLEELSALSDLRLSPGELGRALDGYAEAIRESMRSLQDELARDRLLGKLDSAEGLARQRLARRQQEHLAMLERIRDDPGGFDWGPAVEAARRRADELFQQASGEPAQLVAEAESYRWRREMTERARAESFRRELLAYRASPRMYRFDRWMDVWDKVLPGMVKYVLGVDRRKLEVWLNWERGRGAFMEGAMEGQPSGGE